MAPQSPGRPRTFSPTADSLPLAAARPKTGLQGGARDPALQAGLGRRRRAAGRAGSAPGPPAAEQPCIGLFDRHGIQRAGQGRSSCPATAGGPPATQEEAWRADLSSPRDPPGSTISISSSATARSSLPARPASASSRRLPGLSRSRPTPRRRGGRPARRVRPWCTAGARRHALSYMPPVRHCSSYPRSGPARWTPSTAGCG